MTVSASPFAYTDTDGFENQVFIVGGTVTARASRREPNSISVDPATKSVVVEPGDILTVTYSSAPTIRTYSMCG